MGMAKIKKGDNVVVLSGKDKGKTGTVAQVLPKDGKVVVEGVNMIARHRKPARSGRGAIARWRTPSLDPLRDQRARPLLAEAGIGDLAGDLDIVTRPEIRLARVERPRLAIRRLQRQAFDAFGNPALDRHQVRLPGGANARCRVTGVVTGRSDHLVARRIGAFAILVRRPSAGQQEQRRAEQARHIPECRHARSVRKAGAMFRKSPPIPVPAISCALIRRRGNEPSRSVEHLFGNRLSASSALPGEEIGDRKADHYGNEQRTDDERRQRRDHLGSETGFAQERDDRQRHGHEGGDQRRPHGPHLPRGRSGDNIE